MPQKIIICCVAIILALVVFWPAINVSIIEKNKVKAEAVLADKIQSEHGGNYVGTIVEGPRMFSDDFFTIKVVPEHNKTVVVNVVGAISYSRTDLKVGRIVEYRPCDWVNENAPTTFSYFLMK